MTISPFSQYLNDFKKLREDDKTLVSKAHPFSAQIVTLNLSKPEVEKLKKYLENDSEKIYKNKTFVNDCMTMIVRALKANTSLDDSMLRTIDASPSLVMMYFSLLQHTDSRVGPTYTLVTKPDDKNRFTLLHNAYINKVEGALLLMPSIFTFHQLSRMKFDFQEKKDTLTYLT